MPYRLAINTWGEIVLFLDIQSVAHRLAESLSHGSLLDIPNLRPCSELPKWHVGFNKTPNN